MNLLFGIIIGIVISAVGLVNVARWTESTVESFKHDVVKEAVK